MQTRQQSLNEVIISTAIGFAISLTATFIILPLFGIKTTPIKNLGITIAYTFISIARGYFVRRYFNIKHRR